MFKQTRLLVCGMILVMGAASWCRADEAAAVRATVKDFSIALANGDAAEAKKHIAPDKDTEQWIDLMTEVALAQNHLQKAVKDKFGEEAVKKLGLPSLENAKAAVAKATEAADVNVDGETAVYTSHEPPVYEGQPQDTKLKKSNGRWLIEVTKDAVINKNVITNLGNIDRVVNETAKEITAGKYATFEDAQKAMLMKMLALMKPGAGQ